MVRHLIKKPKSVPIGVMSIVNSLFSIMAVIISICIVWVQVLKVNVHQLPKKMNPLSICKGPKAVRITLLIK